MARTVTATITDLQGIARDQVLLPFMQADGMGWVFASSDAAGAVRAELLTDTPYVLVLVGGYQVDGTSLSTIGAIKVTVPEGEGTVPLIDCATAITPTEWPVLLGRLEGVEAAVQAMSDRIADLEAIIDGLGAS